MTSFVVKDETLDPEIRDTGKSLSYNFSGTIDSGLGRTLEMINRRSDHPGCLKAFSDCEFPAFKETCSSVTEISS